MKCSACDNNLLVYGFKDGYRIYYCKECGLGVTATEGVVKYNKYHRDEIYIQEKSQFENIFSQRVKLINKFMSPGKVLEVGSSAGLLLGLLQGIGWEVLGIEPSTPARAYAIKREIPTLSGNFEDAKIKPDTFDLVIFNHVFEHLDNLPKILDKVNQILKVGRIIFIDVPNFGSLRSKIYGVNWGYLYPQEHKWHFTKESLEKLLEKHGFNVVYSETRSGIWDYGNPVKEVWESLTQRKKRFFSNIVTFIPTWFLSKTKFGSGLTVIAKKVA